MLEISDEIGRAVYYCRYESGAVVEKGTDPLDFAGEFVAALVYDREKNCRLNIKSIIDKLEDTYLLSDVLVGCRCIYRRICNLYQRATRYGQQDVSSKWMAGLFDVLLQIRSRLTQMKELFLDPLISIAARSPTSHLPKMETVTILINDLLHSLSDSDLRNLEKLTGIFQSISLGTDPINEWSQSLHACWIKKPETLEAYLMSEEWIEERLQLMKSFEDSAKHHAASAARREPTTILSDLPALYKLATNDISHQRIRFVTDRNQMLLDTPCPQIAQTDSRLHQLIKTRNALFLLRSDSRSTFVSIHSSKLLQPVEVCLSYQVLITDGVYLHASQDSVILCAKNPQKNMPLMTVTKVRLTNGRLAEHKLLRIEHADIDSVGDSFHYRHPMHLLTYTSNKKLLLDCWQIERDGTLTEQQPQEVYTRDKRSDYQLSRVSTFIDVKIVFLMLESGDDGFGKTSRLQLKSFRVSKNKKQLDVVHDCTFENRPVFHHSWLSLSAAARLTALLCITSTTSFSLFAFNHSRQRFASISQGDKSFKFRNSIASKHHLQLDSWKGSNSWLGVGWHHNKQQLLLLHSHLFDGSSSAAESRAASFYLHSFVLK